MALVDEYTAAQDPTFISRVFMAAVFYAVNSIETEDPSTPNHVNRAKYARDLVISPVSFAAQLAQGVIALNQATSGASLSDTVISNSVATIWNMYAGIV